MIIVIDGPEKAGKTTLIGHLMAFQHNGAPTRLRHWGPVENDTVYGIALREDSLYTGLTVWDRSWASEHVYARLLGRSARLSEDPWLGEWLYGRAVQTLGLRAILLGPSPEEIAALRTADDLPVDPRLERAAFQEYGVDYGWEVYRNWHHPVNAKYLALRMYNIACERQGDVRPPAYAGPWDTPVVVLGERRNDSGHGPPGSWLPFTSRYTTEFARLFGDYALSCGWTNAEDASHSQSLGPGLRAIIACGATAQKKAKEVFQHTRVISVPHPSWLHRWGDAAMRVPQIQRELEYELKHLFNATEDYSAVTEDD